MKRPAWQEEIIARGSLYAVGGAVRDRLMGVAHAPEDVDYVVRGIAPEELEEILGRHGRVAHVGRSFGVYKFTPEDGVATVDISFPRTESSTGPGHRDFDVRSDWRLDVATDLGRRDFTINAIARDVATGKLIDPHGGAADIRDRILRVIFPRAFVEDPLRILRGLRFAARFDLSVTEDTSELMRNSIGGLRELSPERIQDEFNKLFVQCTRPSVALALAHQLGALDVLVPELARCEGVTQNEFHPDDVFWHSLRTCDAAAREPLVRWAALLHDVGKVNCKREITDDKGTRVVFYGHEVDGAAATRSVLTRLRYPARFVSRCENLVAQHMFNYESEWTDATVRRFMRRVGEENLEVLFALREADCRSRGPLTSQEELDKLDELRERVQREQRAQRTLKIGDLEIGGDDVMAELGIPAGPRVGDLLGALLEKVIDDPTLNRRHVLLELLRAEYHRTKR